MDTITELETTPDTRTAVADVLDDSARDADLYAAWWHVPLGGE